MPLPKHLRDHDDTPQTAGRKKESFVARALKGRTSVNSGATFGQNDVLADHCEVEVKLTRNKSYSLKAPYLQEVRAKCDVKKMPVMVLNFETYGDTYAILPFEDYTYLLETLEKLNDKVEKK